jgi:cytochrome c biogenesis protein CcmG/thiol:disulfide interchange protein DsbE
MSLRRLLYALPILLLALFAWLAWRGLAPDRDPTALASALIGKPVPQFELPLLDPAAEKLATKDLAGHVTVINFFASWCAPCKAEHPLLFQIGKDYGVAVYGIALQDRTADTRRYIQEMGSPYTKIGLEQNGRLAIDFGVAGVPETFVLDRNGIIRYRLSRPLSPELIAGEIDPLLKRLAE